MGLFGKLFQGKPSKTQYQIASEVASTIDGVIVVKGFDLLCQPDACIVLDSNLSVSFRSGQHTRGGNIFAVARIKYVPEFLPIRHIFKPDEDPLYAGLDMDATSRMEVAKIKMEAMGHQLVDELAYVILREFLDQSPEFSRLQSS